MIRPHRLAVASAIAFCWLAQTHALLAQDPWKEPQDTSAALTKPDQYAWRLFVAMNWPADMAKREADPQKKFGENVASVWESWKLSSGKNDEVFLAGGADPGPWLQRRAVTERRLSDFESEPLQRSRRRGPQRTIQPMFDPTIPIGRNENHMNQPAYDFFRQHELYSVEGQEQLLKKALDVFEAARKVARPVDFAEYRVDFPAGAKEVKAQWRPISEQEKNRYRWEEFVDEKGVRRLFGLTALHITTKDLPNWLWATFEHVDNPKRDGAEKWILPSRDRAAGPKGYPEKMGIDGTRWENYRLRGTQTEFVNSVGQPTLLANSQIEQGFQTTSSCITCHARAAIGPKTGEPPNRLAMFEHEFDEVVIGSIGSSDPGLFQKKTFTDPVTGKLEYLQLDFVWSMMRAKRKATPKLDKPPGFAADIKVLFRDKDIRSMKRFFDLSKYEDVKKHAKEILAKLEDGSMPCDGAWSKPNVDLFRAWVDGGMLP